MTLLATRLTGHHGPEVDEAAKLSRVERSDEVDDVLAGRRPLTDDGTFGPAGRGPSTAIM
jgi:hypothetical protein